MEVTWVYPDSARYVNWSTTSRTSWAGHWERVSETPSTQKPLCWSIQQVVHHGAGTYASTQIFRIAFNLCASVLQQQTHDLHGNDEGISELFCFTWESLHQRRPPSRMCAPGPYTSSCPAGTGACMSHWSKRPPPPLPATAAWFPLTLLDTHAGQFPAGENLKTLGDPLPLRESRCPHWHNKDKSSAEILQRCS